MLFNSAIYWIFLPTVLVLHFLLPHRWRWILLLVASYVFYMSWNPTYLLLIVGSTLIDYVVSNRMPGAPSQVARNRLMLTSATANLGLLFVFKYWNFANDSLRQLFDVLGASWRVPDLDVLLPVGISFYTFQTLGYTIDVWRGQIPPEKHLGRFALYVAFFPQLVAGPIERARQLLPQMQALHRLDWQRISRGGQLALWGLFKKVVIADRLAIYVDTVYGAPESFGPASHLLATYAFAIQIYCDFSGYSDIAIGSAAMLGFDLMNNFRTPYFSTTVAEFWRRWHISLSTWLRDYLFVSLGGGRYGVRRTYLNLATTMILGGLWHGASWNFVIWGAIHGVLLAGSQATLSRRNRLYSRLGVPRGLRDAWRMLLTFHLVCLAFIFFRAGTLTESLHIVTGFSHGWAMPFIHFQSLGHAAIGLAVLAGVDVFQATRGGVREAVATLPAPVRWLGWYALILGIAVLGVEGGAQFIYFQF